MWGFSSGFHHQLQWSSAVLSDSRSHAKQGVRAVIEETCRLILLDMMVIIALQVRSTFTVTAIDLG